MAKLRTRKHRVVLSRSRGGDFGINLFLIIMGTFMFLPMYYVIMQSMKPLDELWMFPPRFYVEKPTASNFGDLFTLMSDNYVPFSRYIFNTVFVSVTGTFGNLLLSSMAAYALSKLKFPGRKFFFNMVVYSLMFHQTVTAIANFLTMSTLHWLDTYLALIVPAFCTSLGLYLMKQFIDSGVSDEMIEAARIDGAGELRIYWQIVMPLVKPAWLTLLVTTFQTVWNSGASVYVWSEQLKTFNSAIATISTVSAGASSAGSVVMMSVPIIIFIVNQAKIVETMGSSGMKD